MFSKALFKQSIKANGWMWLVITVAECFMLSCVMTIAGSGNISNVKDAVEDTIVQREIDASVQKRSLSYYDLGDSGLIAFDQYYVAEYPNDAKDATTYATNFDTWAASKPTQNTGESDSDYAARVATWQASMPAASTLPEKAYALAFNTWSNAMPKASDYSSQSDYLAALTAWQAQKPTGASAAASSSFYTATLELEEATIQQAAKLGYTSDSDECKEMLGAVMYALKPSSDFNDIYTNNSETVPADYDVTSLLTHLSAGDISTYLTSDERNTYRQDRSENSSAVFLGNNMTQPATITKLLDALSKYGVSEEKYESFGYTYASIKHTAYSTEVSFQARYDYELSEINKKKAAGDYPTEADYQAAIATMKTTLTGDLSQSLLASLPPKSLAPLKTLDKWICIL
jgi:hypothetical protein